MESLMEETSESSGSEESGASGGDAGGPVGDAVNTVAGALTEVMRRDSPMPPTSGLIASMERDAEEAGLGGVVQRESGGRPGELEWCQLRCIGQSGSSWNDSPDNYWWPNLA